MAAPLRDAAGPPPAPPRGALPPAPPPGSPRRRRNTSPVAVDEAPLNDLAPAGPRRSPAGSPDRKLALVAEVSPVDDALGDVRVARAAKPGLALVPEIEPTAEAWGDLVAGAVAPPAPGLAPVAEVSPVADALGVGSDDSSRDRANFSLVLCTSSRQSLADALRGVSPSLVIPALPRDAALVAYARPISSARAVALGEFKSFELSASALALAPTESSSRRLDRVLALTGGVFSSPPLAVASGDFPGVVFPAPSPRPTARAPTRPSSASRALASALALRFIRGLRAVSLDISRFRAPARALRGTVCRWARSPIDSTVKKQNPLARETTRRHTSARANRAILGRARDANAMSPARGGVGTRRRGSGEHVVRETR